jgi:hypothetical protein
MITNFKVLGLALLTGLCNQYVSTDLSHLLFYLYHDIGSKDNSFTGFGPTQGCTVGSSIECIEGLHLDALLIAVVI